MISDIENLKNLMGMAVTAAKAGNNDEAIAYYNRVLEVDPTNSIAWLGKGKAVGWLSTLQNIRINESLVAFGHAIAAAGDADRISMALRAHDELLNLVAAIYGISKRHYTEYKEVNNTYSAYVSTTANLIDVLEKVRSWNPSSRPSAEQAVLMSCDLLNLGVSPEFAEVLRQTMNRANAEIEEQDPSYVPPAMAAQTEIEKAQSKAEMDALGYVVAFIVTIIAVLIGVASKH